MKAIDKNLIYFGIIFAALFTFYYSFSLRILPLIFGDGHDLFQALFTISIVLAMISISIVKFNFKKKSIYALFIATPIIISFMFVIQSFIFGLIATLILGVCLGGAQLSFLAYFWRSVSPNQRGKSAALILLISLPIYFLISPILAAELDFARIIILLSIIFAISFIATLKMKNRANINKSENFPEKRTIVLYTIPWIIFSLINATIARSIALNIRQTIHDELSLILGILQIVGALAGALSGGIILDRLGRRTTLAISITLSGISMALSGFAVNAGSLYFANIIDGLSWGIILTTYIFVIWGDLSNAKNCYSLYSIGLIVFFVTAGIGYLSTTIVMIPVIESTLIGCSLIFLCNVPIALAPELLPSEVREKSQIKSYLNKVRKVAEKLGD